MIVSAVLQSMGIISPEDRSKMIDQSTIRRERERERESKNTKVIAKRKE